MTLSTALGIASRTARMSDSTASNSLSTAKARLMTMSTSSAPVDTASAASAALMWEWCAPEGKPHTVATFTCAGTSTGRRDGETHTE